MAYKALALISDRHAEEQTHKKDEIINEYFNPTLKASLSLISSSDPITRGSLENSVKKEALYLPLHWPMSYNLGAS